MRNTQKTAVAMSPDAPTSKFGSNNACANPKKKTKDTLDGE
jgi:hypothetical protein